MSSRRSVLEKMGWALVALGFSSGKLPAQEGSRAECLAQASGLNLDPDRLEVLRARLDRTSPDVALLRAADVGDAEPAFLTTLETKEE
ncbi:MAG: hypothetical protein HY652_08645 [Acidobacteria bacterium]|nr:hypothetical protein [Acidobacteriota bacterium]